MPVVGHKFLFNLLGQLKTKFVPEGDGMSVSAVEPGVDGVISGVVICSQQYWRLVVLERTSLLLVPECCLLKIEKSTILRNRMCAFVKRAFQVER